MGQISIVHMMSSYSHAKCSSLCSQDSQCCSTWVTFHRKYRSNIFQILDGRRDGCLCSSKHANTTGCACSVSASKFRRNSSNPSIKSRYDVCHRAILKLTIPDSYWSIHQLPKSISGQRTFAHFGSLPQLPYFSMLKDHQLKKAAGPFRGRTKLIHDVTGTPPHFLDSSLRFVCRSLEQ